MPLRQNCLWSRRARLSTGPDIRLQSGHDEGRLSQTPAELISSLIFDRFPPSGGKCAGGGKRRASLCKAGGSGCEPSLEVFIMGSR